MRQIAIIGLGKFGRTVARELTAKGADVIAVDNRPEKVEEIKDSVTYSVGIDTTDENALRAIGIQNVDIALVCIGEDIEANLLTTVLLKKMGVKKIWSRAISPLQKEIIEALEVDNVINLEEEMGKIVANSLISVNIAKHIPIAPGHSIAEVVIPKGFIDKTIRKIKPRENFMVNIVAIKKNKPSINELGEREFEEVIDDVPSPDKPLEEGDILLVVGADSDIDKFSKQ
ncbi:MAG: TrkA family potassium uptake protein [Elusimicrobiota bacterium]